MKNNQGSTPIEDMTRTNNYKMCDLLGIRLKTFETELPLLIAK